VAFRAHRAALSRRVASVLPLPAVAAASDAGGLAAVVEQVRGIPGVIKRQAYELAGRSPGGAEEAVVGAGGLALGTKVVVTLCVGAAAGGGAICVNQLGGLPGESGQTQSAKRAKPPQKAKPVKAAQADAPTPPASEQAPEDRAPESSAATPPAPEPEPVQTDPPQEFFAGGSSSGGSSQVQPNSTPPSSATPSSGGGSSSQGGGGGSGGEFFGGG
jgi:hypothetical protein